MVFSSAMNEVPEGKAELIQQVLSEPKVDLWKLRELALSEGGLVNGASIESQKMKRTQTSQYRCAVEFIFVVQTHYDEEPGQNCLGWSPS